VGLFASKRRSSPGRCEDVSGTSTSEVFGEGHFLKERDWVRAKNVYQGGLQQAFFVRKKEAGE